MNSKELKLSNGLKVEVNTWGASPPTVSFVYVEVQQDPWFTDEETEVDVTREQVVELVKFLMDAYDVRKDEL